MIKEFVELSKDTGQYNDTVQVTCSPHTGRASREVIITGTTAAGESDTTTITQQAKEQFIVLDNYNSGSVSVSAKGNTYTITGRANVPQIKVIAESEDSLSYITVSNKMAINEGTVIADASGNFDISAYGLDEEYEFSISVTINENKTLSAYSYILRFKTGEDTMASSCNFELQAGTKTYSDITISEFTYPVIPASGGDVYPTLDYSQTWGWNGNITNGGTISSGADISYVTSHGGTSTSGVVTADSKGTVVSDITGIATITVTVSMNGKTATAEYGVQQAANTRTLVYGKPVITDVTAEDIPASGGSIDEADVSYSQSRHYEYDSGSVSNLEALTTGGTVSYGNSISASSRGTVVGTRELIGTLVFTVTMNGQTSIEQDVSIYQQANSVTYGNVSLTVETPVNCDVLGGQYKITPTASQVLTYTSGSTEAGSISFTYTQVSALSGFSLSGQYVNVTENESEVARNGYQVTVKATGEGSKTASKTVIFNQAAGVKSYGPVNITSFYYSQVPASGGVATSVLAYSQTWGWNDDITSGGTITTGAAVSYSGTEVASSGSVSVPTKGTTVSSVTNYTLVTVKVTLNNISAESTAYVTQAANAATSITYGTPSVSLTSAPDIPASGGSVSSGTMTYSQSRTQNYTSGATSALSALTSGGSVSYSTVSAASLGTTVKSRTNVGILTCTVTMNGKSGSDTCAVYQAANAVVSSEEGNYGTSITANRYTSSSSPCPASGGTATLSWSASYQTRNKYTSGSYDSWVTHSATPTISGSGTGFSRSGSTVTASNRSTTVGSLRSATYSASYGTSSSSVTIYQQANSQNDAGITYGTWSVSVVANQYTSANSPCPASGGTCTITRSATRTRVQNYSYTSGATSTASMSNETGTPTLSISGTGASLSGTTVTWASRGITTGAARSATVTANMSGVTATENVYQERNGGDTAKDYAISVSPSTATVAADATSYTFTVTSTYTLVYTSGAEQTGLNTGYDVSTTSSWITANTNKVTFSQNTGTSRRSGNIVFTQINSEKTASAWLYQNAPRTNVQLNITTQGNSGWNASGKFKLTTQKDTYISESVRLSGDSGGSTSITINELNPNIRQIDFEYSGTLELYSGTISIGSSQYSSDYGQTYISPGVWYCSVNISNPSTIWINFNIY